MVDAAIPDRSAGTIESTAAVTATSASPSPNPTTASAAASGPTETSGASSALTPSMPPPASRHPPHMGRRGPRVPVHTPATRPATTIATAMATNWSAIFQPEKCETICR